MDDKQSSVHARNAGSGKAAFFPAVRRHQIASLLAERKRMLVSELAQHFSVSEVTIRTDLEEMQKQGQLVRTMGGALAMAALSPANSVTREHTQHTQHQVREMTDTAASPVVQESETIALERRHQIVRLLKEKGSARTAELTSRFSVSGETIRKDLDWLQERGLAVRAYGGAMLLMEDARPSLELWEPLRQTEKERIARAAADRVLDGIDKLTVSHEIPFFQVLSISHQTFKESGRVASWVPPPSSPMQSEDAAAFALWR